MIAPSPRSGSPVVDSGAGARLPPRLTLRRQVMGGSFCFRSDSQALLALVESAYGGLAPHGLGGAGPKLEVELRLLPRRVSPPAAPPPVRTQLGTGRVTGVMDDCNYAVMSPRHRSALVVVSEDMLEHAYHVRYELIEFAVFILAARVQGLVPLHAACVGRDGRGLLLLGASGAGKSTLALHGLLQGLKFLAEDAVFVQPDSLQATGVANYLHVQADALAGIDDPGVRRWIATAPVIRRRSGVEKFEVDLRRAPTSCQFAHKPLQVIAAVVLSRQRAEGSDALLTAVSGAEAVSCLRADQAYARQQPGWDDFEQHMVQSGVYRLRRGPHLQDSVDVLRQLLA